MVLEFRSLLLRNWVRRQSHILYENIVRTLKIFRKKLSPSHVITIHVDTMLTTIDCCNFWDNLSSVENVKERGEQANKDDDRNIVDLLIDQIEFSNVILLNKIDQVSVCTFITFS